MQPSIHDLPSPGDSVTTRDMLWHAAAGNVRATVVFYDEEVADLAHRLSRYPTELAKFLLDLLESEDGQDEEPLAQGADESTVDIEFFYPDEPIPDSDGVFHILISGPDIEHLLAMTPESVMQESLEHRH